MNNEDVLVTYPVNLNIEKLKKTNITSRSALRNTILCMLARKNPTNFKDNSSIILDKDYFSTLNSPEKHHIFPRKILSSNHKHKEINSIMNFCFIPSSLNKEISKRKPSDYFSEYKKVNNKFEDSIKTHFISFVQDSGIWNDDYELFLKQRGELLLKEVEHLIGGITTIEKELQDNPGKVLSIIENQIREKIHVNLYEYYGESYWEEQIPQDIKELVSNRIKDALRRQPFLKEEYEQPQRKLMLCDLMDYPKIILKNWKVFEDIFGSKEELDKHFKNLKEYRNAIAHSKEMSSITKKEGEIAIEWLSEVLKHEETSEETVDEEDDNELFNRLQEKVKSLDGNIVIEPKKHYIAFKIGNKNFLAVQFRKDKLILYFRGDNFNDPKKMLRDVSDIGHRGTGRFELTLISISDLDYVMKLVKSAHEQIKK